MEDERTPGTAVTTEAACEPTGEGSVACELCDQRVAPEEAVTVDVGSAGRERLCTFCAESLFEDLEVTPGGAVERREPRDGVAPAEESGASAVSWEPSAPGSARGVTGTLLRMHYLSLSLLWAIHRTNVRLTERVIEEVDVQLLAVLGLVLSSFVLTALGLAVGLGAA